MVVGNGFQLAPFLAAVEVFSVKLFGIQADRFCGLSNFQKGLYVLDE